MVVYEDEGVALDELLVVFDHEVHYVPGEVDFHGGVGDLTFRILIIKLFSLVRKKIAYFPPELLHHPLLLLRILLKRQCLYQPGRLQLLLIASKLHHHPLLIKMVIALRSGLALHNPPLPILLLKTQRIRTPLGSNRGELIIAEVLLIGLLLLEVGGALGHGALFELLLGGGVGGGLGWRVVEDFCGEGAERDVRKLEELGRDKGLEGSLGLDIDVYQGVHPVYDSISGFI